MIFLKQKEKVVVAKKVAEKIFLGYWPKMMNIMTMP